MHPSCYHRVEKEFLTLLEGGGCALWVKLHPADDPSRWAKVVRAYPHQVRLIEGERDAYTILAEADYIGAFYSTVLLEAMLFEKPVFQLNPFGDAVPDYSKRGGCAPIPNGQALTRWIQS